MFSNNCSSLSDWNGKSRGSMTGRLHYPVDLNILYFLKDPCSFNVSTNLLQVQRLETFFMLYTGYITIYNL